ncbi:hypothetical protein KY338_05175 [Candidatus Woesearchaeota archaeon]|nr:hypothetical protein [Candidatus Woesearchaeota archaeon]MBW3005542.1 hypothetical protein [Candidatus Woesearchaeota archaeon]
MSIECLATELGAKKDFKHIHFSRLGSVYIDYTHTFSTEILEEALPEEAVRRRRTRKENIDEKSTLVEMLLEHFEKEQITEREGPFRTVNVRARISDMLEFLRYQRQRALQVKIRDSELEETEKEKLRDIWHNYKDKINAVKKLRRETRNEKAASELDTIIQEYTDKKDKASYTLANKIVTGHYTEMIRWELSHPWSYYKINDDRIPDILKKKESLEKELRGIRADAEKTLGKNAKRTITDMNKFFEKFYGTKQFTKIHKRKFAERLGPDIIARRTEAQRQMHELQEQVQEIGRIEHNPRDAADEIKVILDSDRHFEFQRYVDADEILNSRWCFIDIEKPRFDTPQEEVSWVAIKYYENRVLKKEIHTSKKVGEGFKRKFLEEKGFEIKDHYKDENWLMAGVQASINAMNPKVLCTYNTPYDLVELDKTEHGLEYGKRRTRAKKEVTTRFFERINVNDMIVFDPLPILKIAKKFLPNKKLALITQELGLEFKKSIDYRMMAELENIIDGTPLEQVSSKTKAKITEFAGPIAEIENLEQVCAQIIASYVGDDVEILPSLVFHPRMRKIYEHINWISQFADVNFQKAAHTANAVNNLQKKDFFERTGTHLDTIHKRTKAQQRAENRIRSFVKKKKKRNTWINETKEERNRREERARGLQKNLAHFVIPSWQFLRKDMEYRFPNAKQLFEHLDQNKDSKEAYYFLSEYADAFCKYLLHAWGTYIKARDELDARIRKAGLDYYRIDDACTGCRKLLKGTFDEDQIKRQYVTIKTLESILDSKTYISDYWKPTGREENDRELKNALHDDIRKINRTLKQQGLEARQFQGWLNEWLSVEKKRTNILASFAADPENIEILEFEQRIINAASALKKAKAKIIHQKDEHIFTSIEGTSELPEDIPLIQVEEHQKAYIAEDPESGNRIYYPKHGYYGGIKVQEEPSNHFTAFEMRAYGGFLDLLFNGHIDNAVRHLIRERDRFRNNRVARKELLFFIKKSKTYQAYVKGETIKFRTSTEEKTRYDVKYRMRYVEEYNKKGEPERIYITPIEKIKLDRTKYSARIENRIAKLLRPLQAMIKRERDLMPTALEESYPNTKDRSFDNWHKGELKESPFVWAKKQVEQGQVLNDTALNVFASYRIYRNGFRPDFENEEIQCAKAHWACNIINENTGRSMHREQTIVPSSRGGFHIVTKSEHPGEYRYKCTCEHNRIRKKECRHIKQAAA